MAVSSTSETAYFAALCCPFPTPARPAVARCPFPVCLPPTLRREVSSAATREAHTARAAHLRREGGVLFVVQLDLAIRPSAHVLDSVVQHHLLRHSVLVQRALKRDAAMNRHGWVLHRPGAACAIEVLLESALQVVGDAHVVLSMLQLEDVQRGHVWRIWSEIKHEQIKKKMKNSSFFFWVFFDFPSIFFSDFPSNFFSRFSLQIFPLNFFELFPRLCHTQCHGREVLQPVGVVMQTSERSSLQALH